MRRVLLAVPFILIGSLGAAHALPDSLTMTCAVARRAVQGLGAVVISTGPNVFDRYVASGAY